MRSQEGEQTRLNNAIFEFRHQAGRKEALRKEQQLVNIDLHCAQKYNGANIRFHSVHVALQLWHSSITNNRLRTQAVAKRQSTVVAFNNEQCALTFETLNEEHAQIAQRPLKRGSMKRRKSVPSQNLFSPHPNFLVFLFPKVTFFRLSWLYA